MVLVLLAWHWPGTTCHAFAAFLFAQFALDSQYEMTAALLFPLLSPVFLYIYALSQKVKEAVRFSSQSLFLSLNLSFYGPT